MSATIDDIAGMLAAAGVGAFEADGDIVTGYMPDDPADLVGVFETAGRPPALHYRGEWTLVDVRVRSASFSAGRARIEAVFDALHGYSEDEYLVIAATGSAVVNGRDALDRWEFAAEFEVLRERT